MILALSDFRDLAILVGQLPRPRANIFAVRWSSVY